MSNVRRHAAIGAAVAVSLVAANVAAESPAVAVAPHHHTYPAVVRDGGGDWTFLLRGSYTAGSATNTAIYGHTSDRPIEGDWDGNGSVTPGVVRAVSGNWQWLLRNSYTNGVANVSSGGYGRVATDTPVTGDWDGNGSMTIGVVRRENGHWRWLLRNDYNGGSATIDFTYGLSSDIPIVGDWDGNGTDTPGVLRKVNGSWQWLLRNSLTGGSANVSFGYGLTTDKPIVGDWNADGVDTPGVVRGNQWHLRNSNTGGAATIGPFGYGHSSDVPNTSGVNPIPADPVLLSASSDTASDTAAQWMHSQIGLARGSGWCLQWMEYAYEHAGLSLGSSYSAETWWDSHPNLQRTDTHYKRGDLVFFRYVNPKTGESLGHVGIYWGVVNGQASIIDTGAWSTKNHASIGLDAISVRSTRLGYIRIVP